MVIKSKKRNVIAKDLFSQKYKIRTVKPKKGKGSFDRKKLKVKVYVPKAEGEEMSSGLSGSSYACVGLLIEHQPGVISGFSR